MAAQRMERKETGIYRVHQRGCEAGRCRCQTYQATVYVGPDRKLVRKHFASIKEARLWRGEKVGAVRAGTMRAPTKRTVKEAAAELLAGMEDGSIVNRSGRAYKPATVRSYRRALDRRVLPVFGRRRLHEVTRAEVQRFVESLAREGLDPSTVRNTLDVLRVVYRRAVRLGEAPMNPTTDLEVPVPRGRRERIESPARALAMVKALPESERAYWAVALFVGLRRGELRAMRWSDVDLAAEPATIRVERTWDDVEGEVGAKSDAGRRLVALPAVIAQELAGHALRTDRDGDDLVFGATATRPFTPTTVNRRAYKAWKAAGLERLTTHEARHCAASYLIDCPEVSDLELTRAIGHSDVRTTKNIYGHLLPQSGAKVAASMDTLIAAAVTEG